MSGKEGLIHQREPIIVPHNVFVGGAITGSPRVTHPDWH